MQQTIIIQPPLYFSQQNVHIWNTSFHPNQNILACSLINGVIQILKYDSDDVIRLLKVNQLHKGSVRWVTFNHLGTLLASCSEDKRIGFINTEGQIAHVIKKAHSQSINRCQFVDEHIFMSGDDNGQIKLWDLRTTESVFQVKQQSDTITGLRFDHDYTNILSSSLDGTVAIYDVKKGTQSQDKLYAISDSIDQQLNGLQIMKNGKYIICPSSQNSIVFFKRDKLQTICDRIQNIPGSVDCILKVNDNTIISGSQDGFIRGLSIKPNKIVQTLGQHQQDDNFPVESLSLSYCKNIVASTSHDNSIKFYDISQFRMKRDNVKIQTKEEQQQSQSMGLDEEDFEESSKEEKNNKNKIIKVKKQQYDQDQDDSDNQDDSDDSSDDDQMMEETKKKKKKNNHKVNIKQRQKQLKKQKQKSFFKGL